MDSEQVGALRPEDDRATHASTEPASGLGHTVSVPSAGTDPELLALLAKWKARQPDNPIAAHMAVTKFIANLNPTTRVFCEGTVRLEKGDFPAVLTFNSIYRQILAWAPSGKKGAMEGHDPAFFSSNIPHIGIAREVLCSRDDGTEVVGGKQC